MPLRLVINAPLIVAVLACLASLALIRVYYRLKPLIPKNVRLRMRRWLAMRKREISRDVWPILESAGTAPHGWPGWPKGRRFAFVLTHDVESKTGLDRVKELAELEMSLGFRSSFNFIPEGSYVVPAELRHWLTNNGFEVGVHDLNHDGKLYRSRRAFSACAQRINGYLKEWKAVGFRSGFMLHELNWLHDLDALYDMSTFDTDPFEPQPDGVSTIFPFWVSRGGDAGYAELPYTLPQDSTLFLLFRQTSIDIWKRKLDWIAERGGMALVNVHPDYVSFGNAGGANDEFSHSLYAEFLEYARQKYQGLYLPALPREVAEFCRSRKPVRPHIRPRPVCMVTHSYYEMDNRVTRYAEALAGRGDHVDVLSLRRNRDSPKHEVMNGVHVHRIQRGLRKRSLGRVRHLLALVRFCLRASMVLARRDLKIGYELVHVHNIPDFLVFAAWLPKLRGANIILDIHDIVPELYASKFESNTFGRIYRLLQRTESASAAFADHVIISNHLWHRKIIARSVSERKCSVIVNHVDPSIFNPRQKTRKDGKQILLYPGVLQWHQGLDVAIKAFAFIQTEFADSEFHIYGEGQAKESLVKLVEELGLQRKVLFCGVRPIRQMPQIIADADVGVVPKRADSFGNEAYSTKIMEFMSQGLPVIVSRTKIDTFYYDDNVVRFFKSDDVEDLAQAMREVLRDRRLRDRLAENGRAYAARNSWDTKKHEYLRLVDSLVCRRRR